AAGQIFRLDGAVENREVNPLPEKMLGEKYSGTVANVVGPFLKSEAHQANLGFVAFEDHAGSAQYMRVIAGHDAAQQGRRGVERLSHVVQCADVFRQTGAAKRESRQ